MAVNLETLKNPKAIVIVAVALVGGLYLSSKIKNRQSSANTPTEVPVSYSVTSADSTQQNDDLQRQLTEAKQKQEELQKAQEEAQKQYADNLASKDVANASERDAFNQRLLDQQQQLGSQYAAQLASLQATIDRLQNAINSKPAAAQPLPSTPLGNTPVQPSGGTPQQPPNTQAPAVGTQPSVKHYPGLPDNYQMDCSKAYKEFLISFDAIVANIKRKGMSNTATMRQVTQIAIGGFPKDEAIRGPELASSFARAFINSKRVFSGLFPLTNDEFNALQAQMTSLWNGDEHQTVFQSGNYARALYERWNAPYQCGSSQIRRSG